MLKVVHFIHGLNMGGAETLVENYALLLDKSKFKVTVLCYEHCDSPYERILQQNNIEVIYVCDKMPLYKKTDLIAKLWNHFQRYWLIRRELRHLNPDIVHFHLQLSSYIRFSKLKKSVNFFYTQHFDTLGWEDDYPKDIKNLRWLMAHYNVRLVALNQAMKLDMDEMFQTDKTYILNNGIDLSEYKGAFDRSRKRAELNIPQDAFVVAHVGRFDPIKNHAFLVEVFKELKKKKPETFLVMVGKGKTEREIQDKLKNAGLENSCKILNDRTDVAQILRASDAGIFPSVSEGLGIAAIEMQAAGLYSIVSTGVPKDVCISNRLRFLGLDAGAAAWGNTLLEMLADKEPIRYYGIEEWDIRHNVKQLEKMYEDAVKNG